MEVYKKIIIDNVETDYMISNFGNVKNKKNKIRKCPKSLFIILCYSYLKKTKKFERMIFLRKSFKIEYLVANAFIDNPDNKKYIKHIDNDKRNNNVDNLCWSD